MKCQLKRSSFSKGNAHLALQLRRKTSPKIQGSLGHFFASSLDCCIAGGQRLRNRRQSYFAAGLALRTGAFWASVQLNGTSKRIAAVLNANTLGCLNISSSPSMSDSVPIAAIALMTTGGSELNAANNGQTALRSPRRTRTTNSNKNSGDWIRTSDTERMNDISVHYIKPVFPKIFAFYWQVVRIAI